MKNKQRGFALVMTLSLMVLLTVLVVGLLSLSASCLRESSNQRALATARADARLALMLALGALQKSMGPDKRVSASSEILGSQILDSEASSGYASKRNLTGVWESWNYNPKAAGLDYTGEKTRRFKTWLVSDNDPTVTSDPGYPSRPQAQDAIELVGADDHCILVLIRNCSCKACETLGWAECSEPNNENKENLVFAWGENALGQIDFGNETLFFEKPTLIRDLIGKKVEGISGWRGSYVAYDEEGNV